MTMIDETLSVIEKAATTRQQAITDGWILYSELLRQDAQGVANPREMKELSRLIDLLELSPDQLRSDRAAVVEFLKAEAGIARATKDAQQYEARIPAAKAAMESIPALLRKIEEIKSEFFLISAARSAANDAVRSWQGKGFALKQTSPRAFAM